MNDSSRLRKRIASIVAVVAAGAFIVILVRATTYAPQGASYVPAAAVQAVATSTPADPPVTLSIPSLSIHAHVQQVGLTKSGAMAVPNNFTDVAWYKYGPAPGQVGSAVIDGHVDNALSLPGVFKHLKDIQPGADIYATTASGTAKHFVVESTHVYSVDHFPSTLVFTRTDHPRLNLITCDGVWQQGKHMYSERLVVYAVRASS
jgi:sortase (surface protein transpeptidase)